MKRVFQKPYIYYFLLIFFLYLLINLLLSGFYKTVPLIIIYVKTVSWFKLSISLLLSLSIGFLVSLTSVLAFIKYKERKQCKEGIALSGVGSVGGLVVGVCPLCVAGVFPLLLSLVGVSFSFASLPFQGMEIQILVLVVLAISLYILNKK